MADLAAEDNGGGRQNEESIEFGASGQQSRCQNQQEDHFVFLRPLAAEQEEHGARRHDGGKIGDVPYREVEDLRLDIRGEADGYHEGPNDIDHVAEDLLLRLGELRAQIIDRKERQIGFELNDEVRQNRHLRVAMYINGIARIENEDANDREEGFVHVPVR